MSELDETSDDNNEERDQAEKRDQAEEAELGPRVTDAIRRADFRMKLFGKR